MRSIGVIIIAATAASAALASAQASGLRYGGTWSEVTVTRPGPDRGYSGFVSFGARRYYCDYIRVPNRTCNSGRCRIVSWDVKQRCY